MLFKDLYEAKLYNLIEPNEETIIDLDQQVTLLTGYNGSGKSTVLNTLHYVFSSFLDNEYLIPRRDWCTSFKFKGKDEDSQMDHFHFICPEEFKNDIPDTHHKEEILCDIHSSIKDRFEDVKCCFDEHAINMKLSRNKINKRDSFFQSFFILYNSEFTDFDSSNAILFSDEIILHAKKNNKDLDENDSLDIFSAKKNIDKSLYKLLLEFSVDAKVEKNLTSIYDDLIKSLNETKKKLDSFKIDLKTENKIEASDDQLEKIIQWNDISHNIKSNNSKLYDRPINNFMSILNSFFKETKREFFIDDNGFLVLRKKINRGFGNKSLDIRWYDLSKGEKNLLTLLLLAFSNKDKDTIFLLDEPDLSMHIGWQKKLIKTLINLAPNSKFIIATHSPAMITNIPNQKILNLNKI
ncbi:AAA family ATPase [Acinetobacter nosocomialis]|uniref:AAA family ATPase n=1 Tax=Acinetobacter calcoaceticus/baumannii complex TaxID=909768 RepID=UPI000F918F75|nr:AAA family ATPase [Acinetobacter baumannii]RUT37150.1 ATP-binding protein [Acinetobacter baumannii]